MKINDAFLNDAVSVGKEDTARGEEGKSGGHQVSAGPPTAVWLWGHAQPHVAWLLQWKTGVNNNSYLLRLL